MWYIYLLIGIYLYLPVFSAWVEKASESAKLWFLGVWGITTLLPYFYQFVSPYLWGTCSWNSFGMLYYFAGFNGYLLLGHYLRNQEWSFSRLFTLGLPMFLAGYAITFFGFRYVTALPEYSEELLELFFTYCSLNVVLMTIPVFMFVKKDPDPHRNNQTGAGESHLMWIRHLHDSLLLYRTMRFAHAYAGYSARFADSRSLSLCLCSIVGNGSVLS